MNWQLNSLSGWGVYGTHVAVEMLRTRRGDPVLLKRPISFDPGADIDLLRPIISRFDAMAAHLQPAPGRGLALEFPVLQPLLPGFKAMQPPQRFYGEPDIGIIFFEDTRITAAAVERSRRFARVIAGSSWNADLMRAAGVEGVRLVLQGVAMERFPERPAPQPGPFRIFSGGKMEHRKGQDLILSTFRAFQQRHSEAVLLTAWQNPWPEKVDTITMSPLIDSAPEMVDGRLDVKGWAARHGVPPAAVHDLGLLPNHLMPAAIAQADCALFASRYESGTNLFAMECMAAGLPVVLSACTGHLDIIADDRCYAVEADQLVTSPQAEWGTEGWAGSTVEGLLAALEAIYQDRQEAHRRGLAARAFISTLSWRNQVGKLLDVIDEISV